MIPLSILLIYTIFKWTEAHFKKNHVQKKPYIKSLPCWVGFIFNYSPLIFLCYIFYFKCSQLRFQRQIAENLENPENPSQNLDDHQHETDDQTQTHVTHKIGIQANKVLQRSNDNIDPNFVTYGGSKNNNSTKNEIHDSIRKGSVDKYTMEAQYQKNLKRFSFEKSASKIKIQQQTEKDKEECMNNNSQIEPFLNLSGEPDDSHLELDNGTKDPEPVYSPSLKRIQVISKKSRQQERKFSEISPPIHKKYEFEHITKKHSKSSEIGQEQEDLTYNSEIEIKNRNSFNMTDHKKSELEEIENQSW